MRHQRHPESFGLYETQCSLGMLASSTGWAGCQECVGEAAEGRSVSVSARRPSGYRAGDGACPAKIAGCSANELHPGGEALRASLWERCPTQRY